MTDTPAPSKPLWLRLAPLALVAAALAGFFALGLDRYVSVDALRFNRAAHAAFVKAKQITEELI